MKTIKKAQSPLVSHAMLTIFGVVLILSVVVTMSHIKNDYQEFVGDAEAKEVCSLLKSGIQEIYNPSDYQIQTNTNLGEIILNLPERIGDSNYRCRFVNSTAVIETFGSLNINRSCEIGFNALYNGTSSGGRTKVIWERSPGNLDSFQMVKL